MRACDTAWIFDGRAGFEPATLGLKVEARLSRTLGTAGQTASFVSGSIFVERDEQGLEAARAAGASAYLVKSRAVLELADTVVSVARASGEGPARHLSS